MAKCIVEGFCASNRHKLIQLISHSNDHNINLWSSWKGTRCCNALSVQNAEDNHKRRPNLEDEVTRPQAKLMLSAQL
ncbi:uncharacterized protein PHALS_08164 [Plasmopara halstedii]|uniref:Uncharacterized protein n=1 Tax=Plasmopara halstedii TaxID=4781 RepID=A0A0P1ACJ5_PLAHL|nr:uncharacterized protein PHALS_08164 [Plasmopara halstedii]CEG38068.1 hypothetical protein PHALS_08164 [Plasmopara halstedii]|eukprot:XP_024574437.1 hypothetical protein PHALS_08164 [Plasmopara halstedii]